MLVGYARVSTLDQNPELQQDALHTAGCEEVFTDKVTGTAAHRPELQRAKDVLRQGDTLVVWRLDRLGRSLKDLIEWVAYLESKGIGFRSLQEAIDTTTPSGRLVFHMFAALAEFERNLIRERTRAGLVAARARGRKGGRPKTLSSAKMRRAVDLYNSKNVSVKEICTMFAISKPTLYTYVRESQGSQAAKP